MTLTTANWSDLAEELHAQVPSELLAQIHPRFNVAPTQPHPVVALGGAGQVALCLATWGFPGKSQGPLIINARAETVPFKPMFRDAFVNNRCVVVADGFLEWRKTPQGRQPLWFRRKDRGLLYFAGLVNKPSAPGSLRQFVVLTTSPNPLVAAIHDRMPAVLTAEDARCWLAAPQLELLRPAPASYLSVLEVSSRVNSTAHDDPACLAPRTSTRQQLSLF